MPVKIPVSQLSPKALEQEAQNLNQLALDGEATITDIKRLEEVRRALKNIQNNKKVG